MKHDIQNIDDIKLLVNSFYEKVKKDKIIGYIFTDAIKIDWETHLLVMYQFWENVIFFTGSYKGNPMIIHQHINSKISLTTEHFKQWLHLFIVTIDELFAGEKAEFVKQRAISIATVMQIKILHTSEANLK